jgi:hypothetical protein
MSSGVYNSISAIGIRPNSMIKCGADVNTKSFIGITPLMDAVTIRDHVT